MGTTRRIRRSNENTNGLPRQHLPNGADLSVQPAGHLDHVAMRLSTSPRER